MKLLHKYCGRENSIANLIEFSVKLLNSLEELVWIDKIFVKVLHIVEKREIREINS